MLFVFLLIREYHRFRNFAPTYTVTGFHLKTVSASSYPMNCQRFCRMMNDNYASWFFSCRIYRSKTTYVMIVVSGFDTASAA